MIDAGGDTWHIFAAGLDMHTVISGDRGDIGTLTFQPFLLRIDNAERAGPLFDDGNDWALQWRIANFNYTGIGHGKFNIRIGHFEVPFGLEQVEQTNGTLYQLNSPAALGLKADWGATVNGVLPTVEYEVGYSLGSGNEIDAGGNGIFAGRIGSRSDRRVRLGASFLNGEQQLPVTVNRERYGVDLGIALAPGIDVAWELAVGKDDGQSVTHRLAQLRWTDSSESWNAYLQLRDAKRRSESAVDDSTSICIGVRMEPNRHWSLSAQWAREVDAFAGGMVGNSLMAQLRYRL
jgi:hypothetical protein